MPLISEAASEKRRRGRPRMLTTDLDETIKRIEPKKGTDRARQDFIYASEAMSMISLL